MRPDGMYVGKVYSEMNRMTINKSFEGSGGMCGGLTTTFLQHLWHCWVSDGVTE